jgi:hypothetical protein
VTRFHYRPHPTTARPPRSWRPASDEPVGPGKALMLWLDSIPTALAPAPSNTPLTPEEVARYEAYVRGRPGPAGDAARGKAS